MNASAFALHFSVLADQSCNAVSFARTCTDVSDWTNEQATDPASLLSNCIDADYGLISLAFAGGNTGGAEAYVCLESINDGAHLTVMVMRDTQYGHAKDEKNNNGPAHKRHHTLGRFDVMTAWSAAIAARFAPPKAVMRRYDFGVTQCRATFATTADYSNEMKSLT